MVIVQGDCLEMMRWLPSDSIGAVVTDPPYELGMMGKQWDKAGAAHCVEIWAEALRVAKPGAYLVAFASPRTEHRMICAIEDAGWQIRDKLMWIHGQGFPKSRNQTGDWQGWGTALKPAWEPICLARKPLQEKTVAENLKKFGTGAINIDGTRIEGGERDLRGDHGGNKGSASSYDVGSGYAIGTTEVGRWGANLILDPEAGEMLDEQSGECVGLPHSAKGKGINGPSKLVNIGGGEINCTYGDTGGASRFYYCAKIGKQERNAGLSGEGIITDDGRNKSIDNPFLRGETKRQNNHPTVKPLSLMKWLTKLVSPPGCTVLDPFMGSGTTGIACVTHGLDFIGIEQQQEYLKIARQRINYWKQLGQQLEFL